MLTNNMIAAFATYMKTQETNVHCPLKGCDGTLHPGAYSSDTIFNSLIKFGTNNTYKTTELKSWIELGNGVTKPQTSDYKLESKFNFSNYSLDSVSVGFSDYTYGRKIIYTTNCTWKGSDSTTICEIGLFCGSTYYDNWNVYMVAREVLVTPITVNNGDVFTVSIAIG